MSNLTKGQSILARVTKGNANAPWRVVIYGARGIGKSTFASQCPDVLMIPVEEGTNQIRVNQLPQIKSWQELLDTLNALLTEPHDYKAVALDGVDSADALVVAYIEEGMKTGRKKIILKNKKEAKSFKELNDEYGSGYSAVVEEWRALLDLLDQLRHKRGMRVILVGHAKSNRINNLAGQDYDRWEIRTLGRGTVELLCNWSDYVLFANKEVDIVNTGSGRETKTIAKDRPVLIYTQQSAGHDAKTRGDIPFPSKLALDWALFEQTARLVSEFGRDLPGMLTSQFSGLVEQFKDPERKEKALAAFQECAANRHYVYMQGCVKQASDILKEQAAAETKK